MSEIPDPIAPMQSQPPIIPISPRSTKKWLWWTLVIALIIGIAWLVVGSRSATAPAVSIVTATVTPSSTATPANTTTLDTTAATANVPAVTAPTASSSAASTGLVTLNNDAGWSITYPKNDYGVDACNACKVTDAGTSVLFTPQYSKDSPDAAKYAYLRIDPPAEDSNPTLESAYDDLAKNMSTNQQYTLIDKQNITISGFPALDVTFLLSGPTISANQNQEEYIFVKTNQHLFEVLIVSDQGGYPGLGLSMSQFVNYSALKQMLATLKFSQ